MKAVICLALLAAVAVIGADGETCGSVADCSLVGCSAGFVAKCESNTCTCDESCSDVTQCIHCSSTFTAVCESSGMCACHATIHHTGCTTDADCHDHCVNHHGRRAHGAHGGHDNHGHNHDHAHANMHAVCEIHHDHSTCHCRH